MCGRVPDNNPGNTADWAFGHTNGLCLSSQLRDQGAIYATPDGAESPPVEMLKAQCPPFKLDSLPV